MFYIVFGDFLNNPLSSGSNSAGRKRLFLVFLTFQELRDSKRVRSGATLRNFRDKPNELKWDTRRSMGWERVPVACPLPMGVPPRVFSPSTVRFAPILRPRTSFDLKTPIYMTPQGFLKAMVAEIKNNKQRVSRPPPAEIGGTLSESPLVDSTPLRWRHQHHLHQHLQQFFIIPLCNLLANMMYIAIY